MDLESNKFGRGNRELGGAQDLVNQYKLWPYYEFFCKKSLPLSISETHYLHNVVGDTKIKKGEGMELDQLCRNTNTTSEKKTCLSPFEFDVLSEAFHMRELDSTHRSSAKKGLPNTVPKLVNQSRDDERKKRKSEKHRKHKVHQVKDGSYVDNNTIRHHHDSYPLQLKNQQNKKRRAETSNDPSVCKRLNVRQ